MPVQARTPVSSPDNLLFGVYISLDQRMMTELTLEMENLGDYIPMGKGSLPAQGIRLAHWYDAFSDAHLQLPQLGDIDWVTLIDPVVTTRIEIQPQPKQTGKKLILLHRQAQFATRLRSMLFPKL